MASEKRKKVVVSMEKILKPYKDYIKVKLCKKWRQNMVWDMLLLAMKRKRNEIEKWCSDRASNEGLKKRL